MTPSRTWRSSNGSIMPCSSAIFLIQRSALIDGIVFPEAEPKFRSYIPLSPAEEHHDQREDDAGDDRGGQREVEGEVTAADRHVARQPPDRHAELDQQPADDEDDAEHDEQPSHG